FGIQQIVPLKERRTVTPQCTSVFGLKEPERLVLTLEEAARLVIRIVRVAQLALRVFYLTFQLMQLAIARMCFEQADHTLPLSLKRLELGAQRLFARCQPGDRGPAFCEAALEGRHPAG